jgi:23S rRNA pseudouridine2605 synthase
MPAERLQKIIAAAGVASRRKAEEMIVSGRVQVNGQVVTELGSKADPEQDHIRVDGKLLQGPERFTYVALNKPKGYVTTVSDEKKRPTVMDLVRGRKVKGPRVSGGPSGLGQRRPSADDQRRRAGQRADESVIQCAEDLCRESCRPARRNKARQAARGVSIAEKGGRRVRTAPAKIRLIREGDNPWLEVTIIEGRNRQVRKMFEEVGHHVEKIRRVQYGPLALDVPPGDWRNLTLLEVAKLKTAASGPKLTLPPPAAGSGANFAEIVRSNRRRRRNHRAHRSDVARLESKPSPNAEVRARRLDARAPAKLLMLNAASAIMGRRAAPYKPASLPNSARVMMVLWPGPGFTCADAPSLMLAEASGGAVAAYTMDRRRNSSKIAGEKASHALETPPPIT